MRYLSNFARPKGAKDKKKRKRRRRNPETQAWINILGTGAAVSPAVLYATYQDAMRTLMKNKKKLEFESGKKKDYLQTLDDYTAKRKIEYDRLTNREVEALGGGKPLGIGETRDLKRLRRQYQVSGDRFLNYNEMTAAKNARRWLKQKDKTLESLKKIDLPRTTKGLRIPKRKFFDKRTAAKILGTGAIGSLLAGATIEAWRQDLMNQ